MSECLSDLETIYPEVVHEDGCKNADGESYCDCGEYSEPIGYSYKRDGYVLESGTDGFGIFVVKSPFYTRARFCSPCAPGAGNLDSPDEDGVPTYCLGPEWFEDETAPYPVHKVGE